MQTLAFDGRTGAGGDVILAALVAAGADPGALAPVEAALPVEYRIGGTERNGIAATTVDVLRTGDAREHDRDGGEHGHADDGHADRGDHDHGGQDHSHGSHAHDHAEGAGVTRTYAECRELVSGMGLPEAVESDALGIVRLLGAAEARVHGTDLESTAFHEVGTDDAIADIVGAALLVDDLGVDRVVTTPVAAGGGEVSMSHGTYPVPTPAVAYIAAAADWELVGGPVETELLTPTGAAVLAHVAEGVDSLPSLSVGAVGYGAGTKSLAERPNVLRATVGTASGGLVRDGIRVLETNVDDVTPETLGGLHDSLAAVGARDVTVVPTTMKKSRPGHLVRVVVKPDDVDRVARRLAVETGTLGIRETATTHRWIAERSIETVSVAVGGDSHGIDVKIAADDAGTTYDVSAEHDDCVAVAAETDESVREIRRLAEAAYRERSDGGD